MSGVFVSWILTELESGSAANVERAKTDMRQAIEWGQRAWNEIAATTIQNCWRKVEILPREVQHSPVGPSDCVIQELAEWLTSFAETSGDPRLEIQNLTDDPSEPWTESPHEDDAQDSELVPELQVRDEEDQEEADESVERVPMTLAKAREASEALWIFLQENQTEHSELRDFMGGVESLSRVIEKMRFPARSKQTRVTDYFSREPASGGSAWI